MFQPEKGIATPPHLGYYIKNPVHTGWLCGTGVLRGNDKLVLDGKEIANERQ